MVDEWLLPLFHTHQPHELDLLCARQQREAFRTGRSGKVALQQTLVFRAEDELLVPRDATWRWPLLVVSEKDHRNNTKCDIEIAGELL
jgi:hypothetical protein